MTITVAVTGASGFVGRYVVREALSRGWNVRALVRSRAKAQEVLPSDSRVGLIVGNVLDRGAMDELTAGLGVASVPAAAAGQPGTRNAPAEPARYDTATPAPANAALIHLIGIIREAAGGQTFERMHVEATRSAIEAAARSRILRYVHMSALGVGPEGKAEYQKTKWAAEELVRAAGVERGLEWTILRPTLIHGADGEFIQMVAGLASGQEPPYTFLPYFTRPVEDTRVPLGPVNYESARVQPVAVEDVAYAFCEAVARPATVGEIYNLVGPDTMNWPEMMETIARELPSANHSMKSWGLPGPVAVGIAKAAKVLGLGGVLPFNEGQARMAMEDSVGELVKVREHLGLTPRPFLPTLRRYAPAV